MMTNNNSMAVQAPASAASLSVYSNIILTAKALIFTMALSRH